MELCPRAGKANLTFVSSQAPFQATRWSLFQEAAREESPASQAALARLCEIYWPPLYAFARHQKKSPQDAEDLVQGFFAALLNKDWLASADQEK